MKKEKRFPGWLAKCMLLISVLFLEMILPGRVSHAAPAHCPYDINCSIWYTKLTKDQQLLLDRMYDACWEGKKEVDVPANLSDSLIWGAEVCLREEMGELCSYGGITLEEPYKVGARDNHRKIQIFYETPYVSQKPFIDRISKTAAGFHDIYDVYEYICRNVDYYYENDHIIFLRANAYDVMKTGKAVCAGYAHLMTVLCHFAGIECSYVVGDGLGDGDLGNHAWNVVRINGKYTYVDSTWDDYGDHAGYQWFGLSGEEMNRPLNEMSRWWVPACVSLKTSDSGERTGSDSDRPVASGKYGRNSYDVYDMELSWDEAEKFCRNKGGHLVSLRDTHEMAFVGQLTRRSGKDQFWIGLQRGDNNRWTWTDGSRYFYSKWDVGQPDNYQNCEDCVRFSNKTLVFGDWIQHEFRWVDTASAGDSAVPLSTFGFICEIEH